MTKEEEVLNAITTETEAEVEEDVIPSRRRRFIEEKGQEKCRGICRRRNRR